MAVFRVAYLRPKYSVRLIVSYGYKIVVPFTLQTHDLCCEIARTALSRDAYKRCFAAFLAFRPEISRVG